MCLQKKFCGNAARAEGPSRRAEYVPADAQKHSSNPEPSPLSHTPAPEPTKPGQPRTPHDRANTACAHNTVLVPGQLPVHVLICPRMLHCPNSHIIHDSGRVRFLMRCAFTCPLCTCHDVCFFGFLFSYLICKSRLRCVCQHPVRPICRICRRRSFGAKTLLGVL